MLRRALLILVSLAMALAACGDDGGGSTARSATTTSRARSTTTSSTTSDTTTEPPAPVTTAPPPLPFAASIKSVTAEDLYASWRPGCPVPVEQLRALDVRHFGND